MHTQTCLSSCIVTQCAECTSTLACLPVNQGFKHMALVVCDCSAQTGNGGKGGNGALALDGNSIAIGGLCIACTVLLQ